MINRYRIATNRILDYLTKTEENQRARLDELKAYDGLSLKLNKVPNGNEYYFVTTGSVKGGKRSYKYLGKEPNETVRYVKEVKHLKKALSVLGKNIKVLYSVLDEVKDFDSESIDQMLPVTYRNAILEPPTTKDPRAVIWKKSSEAHKALFEPPFPEELTQPTDDGSRVRTKGEALIYNLLLRLGITFVYELPTKINDKIRFPDFSILSEVDYKRVILIEHQGMMNNKHYSEKFNERVVDYLKAGYVSGINIYYTFDTYGGITNTDPILDIIKLKIRPDAGRAGAASYG